MGVRPATGLNEPQFPPLRTGDKNRACSPTGATTRVHWDLRLSALLLSKALSRAGVTWARAASRQPPSPLHVLRAKAETSCRHVLPSASLRAQPRLQAPTLLTPLPPELLPCPTPQCTMQRLGRRGGLGGGQGPAPGQPGSLMLFPAPRYLIGVSSHPSPPLGGFASASREDDNLTIWRMGW